MIRKAMSLGIAGLVATVAGSAAVAEERRAPRAPEVSTQDFGGVSIPSSIRVAIVVDPTTADKVVRSKGVDRIRRNGTGAYCIDPAGMTSTTVRKTVPMVTVDYTGSGQNGVLAQIRSRQTSGNPCFSTEFQVMTFEISSGRFVPSNRVSFMMIVP